MAQLYQLLFDNNNIRLAIQNVFKQNFIAGKDGITKHNFINTHNQIINEDRLLKEVKRRLRRCAKLSNISNLYDLIAQQCVYQVILPIIKPRLSIYDYSIDEGSIKIPLSRMCSTVINSHGVYAIKAIFTIQDFNNIPLSVAIGILYDLGITDSKLLSTIKYLMWVFTNNGIGLDTNTILGKLLISCYLYRLDQWIENNIEFNSKTRNTRRDLNNHSNDYMEWLLKRNKKPHAKYYRYYNEIIILTSTRSEQIYINTQLNQFIIQCFNTNINCNLTYNQLDFLKFHIKRMKNNNKWNINITPSNVNELHKQIKQLQFRSPIECIQSLQQIIKLMNYYDIANNLVWLLELINSRMNIHTRRTGTCLKRLWNKVNRKYEYTFKYCNKEFIISIWKLRRIFKVSYKEYITNPLWLILREHMNNLSFYIGPYHLTKWELWAKQKGKDTCTNNVMDPKTIHIHHKDGNRLNNDINNLVLIDKYTHYLIHNNVPTNNCKILTYRKNCKKLKKNC